ncbi:hypothetical protein [Xanthobacter agilis]|uniref:hypothetical protein n=1 Tax=Xanthobacter agilis TaxID=47492 RepID=UPI00372BCC54
MWWFLVLLGILIALAGLFVIAIGIFVFVTTFGNTLITTGAVAASGGLVITAMGLVLRQMERLSQRIETAIGRGQLVREPAEEIPVDEIPADAEEPAPRRHGRVDQPAPASDAPRPDDAPQNASEAEPQPENEARQPPQVRRQGGFDFSHRPSREPAPLTPSAPQPQPQTEALAEQAPAPQAPVPPGAPQSPPAEDPMVRARRERLKRRAEAAARQDGAPAPARPRPGLDVPPRAQRPEEPQPQQPPQPQLPSATPAPEPEVVAPLPDEPRILKSGIVGGMAYTLYSDGSIQAELPDGVVRFASLQELRDHVARAQQMR